MSANPSTLERRLRELKYDGALNSADDYRAAILALLCAEAVCTRIDGKCVTFRAMYDRVFGHDLVTRERKKRGKA